MFKLKPSPLSNTDIFLFALVFLYLIYQLLMPIRMGDTDMWYHLNGGRYFWETFNIPNIPFFSFHNPTKEWVSYFWGFQAIIYKVYDVGGYQGLVIFRALLASATLLMVVLLLKENAHKNKALLLLLIFSMIALTYDGRAYQLRPHLVSYLFILILLYILEYKPRLVLLLPILTILWSNIHGVEWPVPALICGSYALPVLLRKIRKQPPEFSNETSYLIAIILCPIALLINPYGWEVYLSPFNIDADTPLYIAELTKFDPAILTTFVINGTTIHLHTAVTLIFLLSFAFFIWGTYKKTIKIQHAILYIGSIFLLLKGARFLWEWLLLSIPILFSLLADKRFLSIDTEIRPVFQKSAAFLITLLLVSTIYEKTSSFGPYPFDKRGLPTGIETFVHKTNSTGNVLSPPNLSGYIEWALYPAMKNFIDMQFPPSTDMDLFQTVQAYNSEQGLKNFIAQHKPDWLLVSAGNTRAPGIIKGLDRYTPVFSDDILVLYADKTIHPEITETYGLQTVDPHKILEIPEEKKADYIGELKKLLEFSPDFVRALHALASIYIDEKNYEEALLYAERYVKTRPLNPNPNYVLGLTQQHLKQYDKAISSFEKSLDLSDAKSQNKVKLAIATTHYLRKDFKKAYDAFSEGINPYRYLYRAEELFMYAFSAVIVGDIERATKILDMIIFSIDREKNAKIYAESLEMKSKINNGDFDAPSILDWLKSLVQ